MIFRSDWNKIALQSENRAKGQFEKIIVDGNREDEVELYSIGDDEDEKDNQIELEKIEVDEN